MHESRIAGVDRDGDKSKSRFRGMEQHRRFEHEAVDLVRRDVDVPPQPGGVKSHPALRVSYALDAGPTDEKITETDRQGTLARNLVHLRRPVTQYQGFRITARTIQKCRYVIRIVLAVRIEGYHLLDALFKCMLQSFDKTASLSGIPFMPDDLDIEPGELIQGTVSGTVIDHDDMVSLRARGPDNLPDRQNLVMCRDKDGC